MDGEFSSVLLWSQPKEHSRKRHKKAASDRQVPINHRAQRAASTTITSHTHTACSPCPPNPRAVRKDMLGLAFWSLFLDLVLVLSQNRATSKIH